MTCKPKVRFDNLVVIPFIKFGSHLITHIPLSRCTDRCHRIGQTKKVTIYKLVTNDTVDADIYEMRIIVLVMRIYHDLDCEELGLS